MKRLYIDMDGTLCRFYERASCLEKCREPGFFLSLNPYVNLVEAVRILRSAVSDVKEDFRVFILSSVYDDDAEEDKTTWIRRYIGEGIPVLFTEVSMNKAEFIESMDRRSGLTADDYLLDDYSRNLLDWSEAGGTAIKFRNELNGRGWNGYGFSGPTVYFDQDPEELAHDLLSIMGLTEDGKLSPDEPVSEEIMRQEIDRVMSREPFWQKEGEVWQAELYADYQDTLSFNDLYDIFNSSDPHAEFLDLIAERYADADYEAQDHISSVVRKKIGRRGGAFAADNEGFFISDETEILYQDLFDSGIFRCSLPYSHYYKQRVRLNIMIDTGDGARDYTDNSVYPHWDAAPGIEISSNASIVWLAESQGISKTELLKSLTAYTDGLDKTGFLETLAQELINMPSHMSILTFLVETSLENALQIADLMFQDRVRGERYSIRLSKNTVTGLYDPWGGGGSVFSIELEKDVEIPLSIIRSAKPDGCDGSNAVEEIYGMSGAVWKDTLIEINAHTDAA